LFAGLGTDVAQTEHGGAVGDHGNEVAAVGVVPHFLHVILDFETGIGHAGRIGQREVAGSAVRFCGHHLEFAGTRLVVILEGHFL